MTKKGARGEMAPFWAVLFLVQKGTFLVQSTNYHLKIKKKYKYISKDTEKMSEEEFWTIEDARTRELLEDYNNEEEEKIKNYKDAEEEIKSYKKSILSLLNALKVNDNSLKELIIEHLEGLNELNDFRALLLKDEIYKNLKEK